MRIGIVGLGLIGGSFAMATSRRTDHEVLGWDIDENSLQQALSDGAVGGVLREEELPSLDLLLLAVVPSAAVDYVKRHAHLIAGLVIDLCGVKRAVSREILPLSRRHGFQYLGGHPMAGRERGGYESALPDLFERCSMILVPHDGRGVPEKISEYMSVVGFDRIEISDDVKHDRILAYSSHLAHVVSSSYCKSPTGPEHWGYSADSLRDMTRVATLNPVMWSELFCANRDNILKEVRRLIGDMETMADALEREDKEELTRLLEEGLKAKGKLYPRGVEWEESR